MLEGGGGGATVDEAAVWPGVDWVGATADDVAQTVVVSAVKDEAARFLGRKLGNHV